MDMFYDICVLIRKRAGSTGPETDRNYGRQNDKGTAAYLHVAHPWQGHAS